MDSWTDRMKGPRQRDRTTHASRRLLDGDRAAAVLRGARVPDLAWPPFVGGVPHPASLTGMAALIAADVAPFDLGRLVPVLFRLGAHGVVRRGIHPHRSPKHTAQRKPTYLPR